MKDKEKQGSVDQSLLSLEMQMHKQLGITRKKIANDALARYAGSDPRHFQKFILLTNFQAYIDEFAASERCKIHQGSVLRVAHSKAKGITIMNYGVGAPMAALVIDLLSYLQPQAVLMLGMCGGLHRQQKVGDFLVPTAAIRDEASSLHYMPSSVPSLPALLVQHYVANVLIEYERPFYSGVVHTTDYRMWEFDQDFITRLKKEKATAIDMECSALFSVGFARKVPVGALMLISDLPLTPGGIKTKKSAKMVFQRYTDDHLELAIKACDEMYQDSKHKHVNLRRYQFV